MTDEQDPRGELRRAEQALDDSNDRLRTLFDTAAEGIVTIDEAGRIESLNHAAERLFGYEAAEIIGRNVRMLMPSPYAEEHDAYLENYMRTGQAKVIGIGREVAGLRRDGTSFPIRLAVSEFRTSGRRSFAGFITDISEEKKLLEEAELWRHELEQRVEQRTAELARANRELEHFAHTISHDLRTPLRGIRNYVDFLTEDLAGKVEGESADDLRRLGRATDHLEQMIRDLLEYTRIGRRAEALAAVDLGELIAEIAADLNPSADRRVEISGPLPVVHAPRGMLRQIFQNLIENGLCYNRSETRRVWVEPAGGDAERPVIVVRDNGIGIAQRDHEKIFGMFKRLNSESEFPGTGIGLAAARKAVENLGGRIWLESEVGEGSRFYVELPQSSEATPS